MSDLNRRRRRLAARRRALFEALESRDLLAVVTVDTKQVLGTISPDLTGANLPYAYGPDAAWQDGRVAASLGAIHTSFLRYPGGEATSSWHWDDQIGQIWTDTWDPQTQVDPLPADQWMNFDEYIQQVKLAGAKPLVGINIESGYKYNRVQDSLQEAVALVQYAKDQGYNVHDYFIDNESKTVMPARQYAEFVNLYATAMRRVDPTIEIVANWDGIWSDGWGTILNVAGANIDYVDLHTYWNRGNASSDQWQGNELMVQNGETYVAKIQKFKSEIAARGLSTKVGIFEWNLGPCDNVADRPSLFESALMNSETYMQFIWAGLDAAALFPANWADASASGGAAERSLLTPGDLQPTPTYVMLGLYASALGAEYVQSTSSGPDIRSTAAFDPATQTATVYLLQKTGAATNVELELGDYFDPSSDFCVQGETFQGASGAIEADTSEVVPITVTTNAGGNLELTAAPFSLTKITISPTPFPASDGQSRGSSAVLHPASSDTSPLPGAGAAEPVHASESSGANSVVQSLVVDLNKQPSNGNSDPDNFLRVGPLTFFAASTSATYSELWVTDGTTAGTVRLKDLFAGDTTSAPCDFTEVNGSLFFTANDGISGIEVWKSDGTAAGTVRVADVRPGPSSSYPRHLVNVGGVLYFRADDGNGGYELWKSDGTAAGTVQVADLVSGPDGSEPVFLTNVNGTLFFQARVDSLAPDLWKSDGTAAGTVRVANDLAHGGPRNPKLLTNVNGTLYFRAADEDHGYELWKSDGTAAGTLVVADIKAGPGGSSPDWLNNVNGTLYFRANDGLAGYELWRSDGTSEGTVLAADVFAGSNSSNPRSLASAGGILYFLADDGITDLELWRVSEAGATRLTNLPGGSGVIPLGEPVGVNDTLYFWANDGVKGSELWKSDGTTLGTVLAADISTSPSGGTPEHLTNCGGTLYFSALKSKGRELFTLNSAGQAVQIKDIAGGTQSSSPKSLTNVDGTLYFRATDGITGYELYKADATGSNASLVKDVVAGEDSSNPQSLINVNGTLFFTADGSNKGVELWKSDGSTAGTVLVRDIWSGALGSYPANLTNVNGKLFFSAHNGTGGCELWMSDGTTAGTIRLKEIRSGAAGSYPSHLVNVNGTLFFQATDGSGDCELWKSNGTAAGTVLVKNIRAGSASSAPRELVNANGTLFFQADDGIHGRELWKSNGTAAGTICVRDIVPGTVGSTPRELTDVDGMLFFRATDEAGDELWKSDGSPGGTARVEDIFPGAPSSRPRQLTNLDGTLYFSASDGQTGYELWRSNGTAAGTQQVKDLAAGAASSYVMGLCNANGTLCFQADNGLGDAVWLSDGTEAGTVAAFGLTAGDTIQPFQFTTVGAKIFYTGGSDSVGSELWRVNRAPIVSDMACATAINTALDLTLRVDDPDRDTLNFQIVASPEHGSLSGQAPDLVYTPAEGYLGSDSFSFRVTDGTFTSDVVVVALNVVPINHAPIATEQEIELDEDTPQALRLEGTDSDIDGQTLTYLLVDPPQHGVLTGIAPNLTYIPAANYNGADSFSFKTSDGTSDSNTAVIRISVRAVNDAPLLHSTSPLSIGPFAEDATSTVGTLVKFLVNDITDVDAGAVKGIGVNSAETTNGVWQFSLDGATWQPMGEVSDASARLLPADNTTRVRFVPNPNFNGQVRLGFRAWDQTAGIAGGTQSTSGATGDSGSFSTSTAIAVLTISPVNDAPIFTSIPVLAATEDAAYIYHITASDVDSGASLTISASMLPSWLTLTDHGDGTATLSGTPLNGNVGPNDVVLALSDGIAGDALQSFTITVANTNDAPTFISTPMTAATEDTGYSYDITATDLDAGATLTITASTLPTWLTLIDNGDGTATLSGTPRNGDVGSQEVVLVVSDGIAGDVLQSFTISVANTNDAPTFTTTPVLSATEDAAYTYHLTATDIDAGASLTITASTLPSWLTLTDHGDGTATLSGTPLNGNVGPQEVVLVVSDGIAADVLQSFTITVANTNDAPVLKTSVAVQLDSIDEDETNSAGTLVSALVAGISDVDAGALQGIAVSGVANAAGKWQYTLDSGTTWLNLGSPTQAAARLLPADSMTRVRFVPNANFSGSSNLWFFAWDQTQGLAGDVVDLSLSGTTGGTTAFSTSAKQAFLTINPVNDAPVLKTSVAVQLDSIDEDETNSAGTLVSSLVAGISDVDAGALPGIAVSGVANSGGKWQYTLDSGTTWLNLGSPTRAAARLLPADNMTRVRFVPNANFNGSSNLWFFAWDQTQGLAGDVFDLSPSGTTGGTTAFSTSAKQAFLTINPVNDAPVLGGISGTIGYTLGTAAVTIAPAATVSDVDSPNFDGGELLVRFSDGASADNALELAGFTVKADGSVVQGSTVIGQRTSDGLGTNDLRISLNLNATLSFVQQLLRSITYRTSSSGNRTIAFSVSDGDGDTSLTLTKSVIAAS